MKTYLLLSLVFCALLEIYLLLRIYFLYKNIMQLNETVKKRISMMMDERHYNINSLALNCGLNPSALRMLYSGATKSPSLETLYKIAEFLDCSLDELTGRKQYTNSTDKQDFAWEGEKFKDITDIVYPYIQEKKYDTTLNKTISVLKEAYTFIIMTNKGKVDDRVVKWIVDKNLDSTFL